MEQYDVVTKCEWVVGRETVMKQQFPESAL